MRALLPLLPLTASLLVACRHGDSVPISDVVFVTVDTLRVDHVGAFAADSPALTPHIDALAADSVLYAQAYSPISVTGPAFCTLHTGLGPSSHGVTMNLFRGGATLAPEAETLAERLSAAGFGTGAFVSGFTLRDALNLDQGFDLYDQPPNNQRRPGAITLDAMLAWADEVGTRQPRFLWWHTYDPHGPLDPWGDRPEQGAWPSVPADRAHLPRYQRLYGITSPGFYAHRYARAVEHTDTQVGRVVAWLKQHDRYDDALIVFTADHGESFTERSLWFDHGTTAHEEQLHVPLLIKYPQGWGAGTRVEGLVGLADIAPTVLHLQSGDRPTGLDGHSLRDPAFTGHAVLTGESSHCKGAPVLRCAPRGPGGKSFSARSAAHTLIQRRLSGGVERALYDRDRDRAEAIPLRADDAPPALVHAIDTIATDRATRDYRGYDQPSRTDEDQQEQEALEALGYRDR